MSEAQLNIFEVLQSSSLLQKQSMLNSIKNTGIASEKANAYLKELADVPKVNRDIFYYVVKFMLESKQSSISNVGIALYAAKLEVIRQATNSILNNSEANFLPDGFDLMFHYFSFDRHIDSSIEVDLDDTIDIHELEKIMMQKDGETEQEKSESNNSTVVNQSNDSLENKSVFQQAEANLDSETIPIGKHLSLGMPVDFPSNGIFSLDCLVEDDTFKIHEILIVHTSRTSKSRCRVIGFDLGMQRFVRLTHKAFDEYVFVQMLGVETSISRLSLVKERMVIQLQAKKAIHNAKCDLLLVADDSLEVKEQWGTARYINFIHSHATKNNPNQIWQKMVKSFAGAHNNEMIRRMALACIRTINGESTNQPELFYFVRIKSSRIEYRNGHWTCSLFRKEVSAYKPRIFDHNTVRNLKTNEVYKFDGIAL